MGKTVTTPYAWIDPPITRNPWNLDRTPGGSSSGSAAAVACGMCLAAIGTQTGGSITRPASFCGAAGMKPTYGSVLADGIAPFAPTLDHVGALARTVSDLVALFAAIRDEGATSSEPGQAMRLGRLRGFFDRGAEPVMQTMFDETIPAFEAAGATLIELPDPVDFERVVKDHRRVMAAEAAATHAKSLDEEPDAYPPQITKLIVEGRSLTALAYLNAKNRIAVDRKTMMAALANSQLDALITPATLGPAPGTWTTGDPAFNSPWSYTGLPTVSLPIGLSSLWPATGRPARRLVRSRRQAARCRRTVRASHSNRAALKDTSNGRRTTQRDPRPARDASRGRRHRRSSALARAWNRRCRASS